jgi:hypothetical protein
MGREHVEQARPGILADLAGVAIGQARRGGALAAHLADPFRQLGQGVADDGGQVQAVRPVPRVPRARTASKAALPRDRAARSRPACTVRRRLRERPAPGPRDCTWPWPLPRATARQPSGPSTAAAGRAARSWSGLARARRTAARAATACCCGRIARRSRPRRGRAPGPDRPVEPTPDSAISRLRKAESGAVSTSIRMICNLCAAIAVMTPRRITKTDSVNHVANEVKTFRNPAKKFSYWARRLSRGKITGARGLCLR